MYALSNIEFSNRLGVVVSDLSELPPDEIERQDHTLDARQVATDNELEMAVFGADTITYRDLMGSPLCRPGPATLSHFG